MKKVFAILLCVVFVFGTLPLYASAAESTDLHNELIALACETFPEYADILQNPPVAVPARARNGEIDRVVFRETRAISDNQRIGIMVYQSGYAIVTSAKSFEVSVTDASGSEVGNDYIGSASFAVTCTIVAHGTFRLNNVKYKIFRGKSGSFTSYGDADPTVECSARNITQSPTRIDYALTFGGNAAGNIRQHTTFSLYFDGGALQAVTSD